MFCTSVAWVYLVCLLLCKEEGSSPVSAITERRDRGLYEVPLSMSLLGFRMGTMLANFHMCGIMLVLRSVFNMLVSNGSPRGPMCFIHVLIHMICPIISSCILCVAMLMDLFVLCVVCLTVFVNCLVKQFVISLRVVVIVILLSDLDWSRHHPIL